MKLDKYNSDRHIYQPANAYTEVRPPGSSRIMLHCTTCYTGIDGITRRCSKMCRKADRPTFCKHLYTIPVPRKQTISQALDDYDPTQLFNNIARASASLNFSLNQITSPVFNSLLESAVSFGISLHTKDANITPDKIPDINFSRTKIRQTIIELGKEEQNNLDIRLHNVRFVTAAIDNGTIVHRKLMFVALQNTAAGLEPTFTKFSPPNPGLLKSFQNLDMIY
jgi:hypothetical protein